MSKIGTSSTMKSYASSVNYQANFRRMNSLRKRERNPRTIVMTTKTKDFIQKICYKKTASIDMTQYGFIHDSKMNPVNLMMKPLRAQLEKICGNPSGDAPVRKKTTIKRKVKVNNNRHKQAPPDRPTHTTVNPVVQKSDRIPKSALSAVPRTFHSQVRKLKLEADANSKIGKKKVTLIVPVKRKKKLHVTI